MIGYPDMAAKIAKHLKISVSLVLQLHHRIGDLQSYNSISLTFEILYYINLTKMKAKRISLLHNDRIIRPVLSETWVKKIQN